MKETYIYKGVLCAIPQKSSFSNNNSNRFEDGEKLFSFHPNIMTSENGFYRIRKYKLLKDSVSIKAETIFYLHEYFYSNTEYPHPSQKTFNIEEVENNPEWFEEII